MSCSDDCTFPGSEPPITLSSTAWYLALHSLSHIILRTVSCSDAPVGQYLIDCIAESHTPVFTSITWTVATGPPRSVT